MIKFQFIHCPLPHCIHVHACTAVALSHMHKYNTIVVHLHVQMHVQCMNCWEGKTHDLHLIDTQIQTHPMVRKRGTLQWSEVTL